MIPYVPYSWLIKSYNRHFFSIFLTIGGILLNCDVQIREKICWIGPFVQIEGQKILPETKKKSNRELQHDEKYQFKTNLWTQIHFVRSDSTAQITDKSSNELPENNIQRLQILHNLNDNNYQKVNLLKNKSIFQPLHIRLFTR